MIYFLIYLVKALEVLVDHLVALVVVLAVAEEVAKEEVLTLECR